MAQQTCEVELWVCVDSNGDYSVAKTDSDARENYESEVQNLADTEGHRMVKVTLTVPLPEVVELTGTVPADEKPAAMVVK